MIPPADPDKQKTYLENEMLPRIDEAKAGKRAVFFVDAAHFVLAPFLGFLWSLTRIFIKAPAGRKRFNVLGALNAVTHELITGQTILILMPKVSVSFYRSCHSLILESPSHFF